jgi:hypothetical protein
VLASGCHHRHFYIVFCKCFNHWKSTGVGFWVILYCVLQVFEPLEENWCWHLGAAVGTSYYVLHVFEPLEEHWVWRLAATVDTFISCFTGV